MNTWHKWIVPLLMICVVQVGLVNGAEKAPTVSPDTQLAEELTAALSDLEEGVLSDDSRVQRIALLVARLTRLSPIHAQAMLADFSRQVNTADLGIVSAAAVMSAGTSSPAVLQAMVDAQGNDASRTQALHQGAVNPTQVLGTEMAAMMQPVELQARSPIVASPSVSIPAPVATPKPVVTPVATAEPVVVVAATAPVQPRSLLRSASEKSASQPPVVAAAADSQPPPPQPPGIPPRPPALPYRGQ